MCRHFREDFGLHTRYARYHNVYGPNGTWDGGREKAPAAICRKVIQAKLSGKHEIDIWGDGGQTRSFMYVDNCTFGTHKSLNSNVPDAPKGVRGRNSDNTLIKELLGWALGISLRTGLEKTYAWIFDEIRQGKSEKSMRPPANAYA